MTKLSKKERRDLESRFRRVFKFLTTRLILSGEQPIGWVLYERDRMVGTPQAISEAEAETQDLVFYPSGINGTYPIYINLTDAEEVAQAYMKENPHLADTDIMTVLVWRDDNCIEVPEYIFKSELGDVHGV